MAERAGNKFAKWMINLLQEYQAKLEAIENEIKQNIECVLDAPKGDRNPSKIQYCTQQIRSLVSSYQLFDSSLHSLNSSLSQFIDHGGMAQEYEIELKVRLAEFEMRRARLRDLTDRSQNIY